jgi:hypothetical protein
MSMWKDGEPQVADCWSGKGGRIFACLEGIEQQRPTSKGQSHSFSLQYRSSRALLDFSPFRWLFKGHAVTAHSATLTPAPDTGAAGGTHTLQTREEPLRSVEEPLNWASDAPRTIKQMSKSTFFLEEAQEKGSEGRLVYLVMVRHPLQWLLSMVKESYGLKCEWGLAKQHDPAWLRLPCRIRFHIAADVGFANPLEVWNEYHRGYLNGSYFPPARTKIVRYEELVMETEATMNSILAAAGRPPIARERFEQASDAAKDHGNSGIHSSGIHQVFIR